MASPDPRTRQIAADATRSLARLRAAVQDDPTSTDVAGAVETSTPGEHERRPPAHSPARGSDGAIRAALAAPLAQSVIHHLSRSGRATASELTVRTGSKVTTIRRHLRALRDVGLVHGDDTTDVRRGRHPVAYALVEDAVPIALDAIGRYLEPGRTAAIARYVTPPSGGS